MSYAPPSTALGEGVYGYVGRATNTKAIWALVLGILAIPCSIVAAVPAIVLGILAKNQIDASDGSQSGRGMATAGLVLGVVCVVLALAGVAVELSLGTLSVGR